MALRGLATTTRDALRICCHGPHLRSTAGIALIVGTWLTIVNHGDVLLTAGWNPALALKIAANFLTPFVVSNLGLLSRRR